MWRPIERVVGRLTRFSSICGSAGGVAGTGGWSGAAAGEAPASKRMGRIKTARSITLVADAQAACLGRHARFRANTSPLDHVLTVWVRDLRPPEADGDFVIIR